MFLALLYALARRVSPRKALCALAAAGSITLHAGAPVPTSVRAIAYPAVSDAMPATPCLYARDLPLIAATGANTVRTYGLLPEGDRVFAAVLASTRLQWIAGFRLDPLLPKDGVLARFRAYSERLRGDPLLVAYSLDGEWGRSPEELDELARDARAILRRIEPDRTPAVVTGAETAASFAGPAEKDLFERVVDASGVESLRPRTAYYKLAGLWGGTYPAAWSEKDTPRLNVPDAASPGGLVRLTGSALMNATAPYADESWPFQLGGTCLCAGGQPARLSFVAPGEVAAQVPGALEPGETPLVFYRAGRASNPVTLHVSEFSAGARTGPELEARLRRPR